MGKCDLKDHREKTRLVRFVSDECDDSEATTGTPSHLTTLDFLGFTHYWAEAGGTYGRSSA